MYKWVITYDMFPHGYSLFIDMSLIESVVVRSYGIIHDIVIITDLMTLQIKEMIIMCLDMVYIIQVYK